MPTKMQKGEDSIKNQATGFLSQRFGMVAGQSKSHKKLQWINEQF